MSETIGIMDLGSHSFRLQVFRLWPDGAFRMVSQAKAVVRLAGAFEPDGRIGEDGLQRTLAALKDFLRLGRTQGVTRYVAVATAAVRQAENGANFITEVSEATGVQIQVISEAEESELSWLGAMNTLAETDGLLVDMGGASTELVRFSGRRITACTSLPYGTINLTARFLPGGAGTPEAYSALDGFLSELFRTVPWLRNAPGLPLIGVGGTVRTLARIERKTRNYPLELLHNYRMSPDRVEAIYRQLCSLPVKDRSKLPGLSEDRADIIVSGAAMITQVLGQSGARELVVSGAGLREGLLYRDLIRHENPPLVPDVLVHSVGNLLRAYGLVSRRSEAMARLALALYDGMWPMHGLNGWTRRCLTAAAALAEAGNAVNAYGQDQHAFYLLTRGRLFGLTHRELIITGAAAGFKTGGKAQALVAPYKEILVPGDEELIRRLGLLVAMAKELTRYEPDVIADTSVEVTSQEVAVTLHPRGPITAELSKIEAMAGDFRKAWGRELLIHTY